MIRSSAPVVAVMLPSLAFVKLCVTVSAERPVTISWSPGVVVLAPPLKISPACGTGFPN